MTGAAQGIGLGIARSLATASYKVVLADIEDELLAERPRTGAGEGFEAVGEHLDVTSAGDWDAWSAAASLAWGGLDLLVNCAGISPRGTVETTDEALWDRTMAINLKGAWLGIKAAIPHLRQRRGTIINIGSTRATRPMPGLFSYIVSKAGLWGLTQQVAVEYLAEGITCNMIAPGWVDTPNERLIQARFGRPDFPAGNPQPHHARRNRRVRGLPRLAQRPQNQRRDPLPRCRPADRRRCRAWSICPTAAGRPMSNASKGPDAFDAARSNRAGVERAGRLESDHA